MRRSIRRVCGLVAFVCLAGAGEGAAQSPATGALRGVVAEADGDPLAGVLLSLVNTETSLPRETTSDREGRYRFGLLAAGEYELRVEKLGYGPVLLRRVLVPAGGERPLNVELAELSATDRITAEERDAAGSAVVHPGAVETVVGPTLRALPLMRRQAGDVARLTTRADRQLGLDGLPYWLTSVVVDGTLFRAARHPSYGAGSAESAAFALGGLSGAEIVTAATDLEFGGAAGGWLNLHALRGARETSGFAVVSGSGGVGSSIEDAPGDVGVQGGIALRTSTGDSARLSAGLDVRRLRAPVAAAWGGNATAETLASLSDSYGIDFDASTRAGIVPSDALSGHMRLDWNLAGGHQLGGWAFASTQPELTALDTRTLLPQQLKGTDVIAGASLTSQLGSSTFNDLRVSVTSSSRTIAEPADAGPAFIVSDDLSIGGLRGSDTGREGRFSLTNAVHRSGARHSFKLGAGLSVVAREYGYLAGSEGAVYFGSLDDVLARRGYTVRVDGAAPAAEWQTLSPVLFLQDRMELGEGVALEAGLRAERWQLPADDVPRDAEWQRLSGLANDSVDASGWYTDVRASLTWDVQRTGAWLVQANAGLSHDEIDPLLVAQWQMDAGTARVRREFGTVRWPEDPGSGGLFRRVTLLGSEFAPPRTVRGGAGVTYAASARTTMQLSGTVRRTENLPRRTDLNRLPVASFQDQYGRPLYGTPLQSGGSLVATPGTGRRFADYDEAAGVNADGWSEHWGVTLGVQRELGDGSFAVRYTFSQTRDNWFGGREGGWTVAPPAGLESEQEWAEGVSDFDAPHRLAALLDVGLPFAARLSAIYRVESGLPFTPGFRRGVDANADGYMGKDPAFVDPSLTGMNDLTGEWSCVAEARSTFADRNSCRGPLDHSLDASVRVTVFSTGRASAALSVDGFDLLGTAGAPRDAALLLVDPAGTTTQDSGARLVNVPLMVNPNFGEELTRPHTGRLLRLSLHVTW